MLITTDGYGIIHYEQGNKIVIMLPSTASTAESTLDQIVDRRESLTTEELTLLVNLAKYMFERK